MGVAPLSLWIGFTVGIVVLLLADLIFFHKASKTAKQAGIGGALKESAFWVLLSLAFYAWFSSTYGNELGVQFLTGYIIEKSLSVDNLFVILLIFQGFKIPAHYQHRVLFWGVLGAIVFRGFFIIFGAQLISMFHWILYLFGLILIVTAIKLVRDKEEEHEMKDHWSIKYLKKLFPVTPHFHDQKFFVHVDHVLHATPLFVTLVIIEITDIVFAVDSIPAVFSVTQDAFVAFSSNILALLGLRALYFVIADSVAKLRYLKPGLAVILGFVGFKMLIADIFHIPSWVSLMVIINILFVAGLSSWYVNKREEGK